MANNNLEANQEEDRCQEPKSVFKGLKIEQGTGGEMLGWEVVNYAREIESGKRRWVI